MPRKDAKSAGANGARHRGKRDDWQAKVTTPVSLGHERTAVEAALGTAQAAVETEERRIRDAETEAEISRLRGEEDRAGEEYGRTLVSAGIAFEKLLAAEDVLASALANARRPYGRGFQTPARVAWEQAEEAARGRLRRARADGTCGASSHLEETPIPHAGLSKS